MKKRFYKKISEIPDFTKYLNQLESFILNHPDKFFSTDNMASSFDDFDHFNNYKTDREHLVMPGECLVIDLVDSYMKHSYLICEHTRRKYKTPRGRMINFKILHHVILVEKCQRGSWRNGYFLLPVFNDKGEIDE